MAFFGPGRAAIRIIEGGYLARMKFGGLLLKAGPVDCGQTCRQLPIEGIGIKLRPMNAREIIVDGPTPLQRAKRLSDELGIDLFIKRDDLAGPSMGGNKSRQLEYYFGAALAMGADTILITGAVQSNFVRLAAAVARAKGLHPIVQLENRVQGKGLAYHSGGNVLLSKILDAEILTYPEGEDEAGADAALHARAEDLKLEGRVPYIIHLSEGHPPLGALGYVDAAHEILDQSEDFDAYVVASGSGSTHAGLLAGLRGAGSKARVIGGCVRRPASDQSARIGRITRRLAALYDGATLVTGDDIVVRDDAFAPGYGQIGPRAARAMKLMARLEGLMLDPVYTAKSFATLLICVENGDIPAGSRVCFVHTGGLAALFAYDTAVLDAF